MDTKGKSMTTSVPSIAIRFHANAEQIEELYASDDDQADHNKSDKLVTSTPNSSATASETESSPLRNYFPKKLVKRSTSIDAGPLAASDSSPPSDPWRFFSNLTGKITKSVEDKLTEIKTRNQEEGSPQHKSPINKDNSKESSLSDSEDMSESSISKTCGIASTTDGVEMSSDDETPSIEKDKKLDKNDTTRESKSDVAKKSSSSSVLSRRFRLMKNKTLKKEGNFSTSTLAKLYALKTGIEPALADDNSEEVESGVDALEEVTKVQGGDESVENETDGTTIRDLHAHHVSNEIINNIIEDIDNIDIDDEGVINVHEINGMDIKTAQINGVTSGSFFAPTGFVDLRQRPVPKSIYWTYVAVAVISVIYYYLQRYSAYLAGAVLGMSLSWAFNTITKRLFPTPSETLLRAMSKSKTLMDEHKVFEIPAIKEYEPINKFEGWMNELPDNYDPHSYHITQTQSVYLKLQSYMLRISHTKTKIPKRALWNEPHFKPVFMQHRIYNLLGAKIMLLPEGLTKKRQWSKKYPICIVLPNNQLNFEYPSDYKIDPIEEKEHDATVNDNKKVTFTIRKRKSHEVQPQRFSKLTEEEEEYELESEASRPSSPSPTSDENGMLIDLDDISEEQIDDDVVSLEDDEWTTFTPGESPTETETVIYLFGRTDREKEDWYRRLAGATRIKNFESTDESNSNAESVSTSSTINAANNTERDYLKYMAQFQKARNFFKKKNQDKINEDDVIVKIEKEISVDVLWVNALLGRILYDCMNDPSFTLRVKERIQRKLSAIKLPYFIEGLTLTELSLGNSPPLIQKVERPLINQRGLWVDLRITYEGSVVLYVLTKLNLMRLKQPPEDNQNESDDKKSAIFHSDVDDTAESSTDDDAPNLNNNPVLDSTGYPLPGIGGTSNKSKRFIKMVDRIAESKFFKAATEIGYIKKAMEEVSNTELKLKVELKSLCGVLVLNIPPPPSDRVWIGFRPIPDLHLSAQPIVGERNITMMSITSWIEKKLLLEFHKLLVIPNMEDIMIPVMNHNLPE